jgi:hypothetical protein
MTPLRVLAFPTKSSSSGQYRSRATSVSLAKSGFRYEWSRLPAAKEHHGRPCTHSGAVREERNAVHVEPQPGAVGVDVHACS